jgi:endo-1,4-beta-xylanase
VNDLWYRRSSAEVVVTDPTGMPLADTVVMVEQVRHDFAFGNIGFDLISHANEEEELSGLAADWLALFNTATLPFYWGQFETDRGVRNTSRIRAAADWFAARGVRVKGHPLVWHSVQPHWLDDQPLATVERLLRERIRREVHDFDGVIQTWDAINEVVIMPEFANEPDGIPNAVSRLARSIGRVEIIRLAFDEARSANGARTLILNDFDLSSDYENLIEAALDAGIRIDAIGLQTHMHQGYWGESAVIETVDRFARFGLPIHLTETTLLSGDLMPAHIVDLNDYHRADWPSTTEGEERQADEIVRHYRSLFGHPAVAAITYWGITDRGAWLGAPSGLVRADGSRKPAFAALHSLVAGEWWMPTTERRTDSAGRLRLDGFRGDYAVRFRGLSGAFRMEPDAAGREVRLA